MPIYAEKYVICAFCWNMQKMWQHAKYAAVAYLRKILTRLAFDHFLPDHWLNIALSVSVTAWSLDVHITRRKKHIIIIYICSFALPQLKVLSLLWLANHCQLMSVVCWKLIVKSHNDCYFVLGWWVQCRVLCQQWCCACWSWWNTESYEACCCTGNTQRGSVSCTFRKFSGMVNALSSE